MIAELWSDFVAGLLPMVGVLGLTTIIMLAVFGVWSKHLVVKVISIGVLVLLLIGLTVILGRA